MKRIRIFAAVLMLCVLALALISCQGKETAVPGDVNSPHGPKPEQFIPVVDDSLKSVHVPISKSVK